jgi:opacity protein-like surface antigen
VAQVDQTLGMSTTLAPNIPAGIPTRTTTAILQSTYGIARDWSFGVRGGYTRGEFIGFGDLNNHGWMAGASFNYQIWRNLLLTLDYQYTTTQSNTLLASFTEFTDNRYTAGLTYKY